MKKFCFIQILFIFVCLTTYSQQIRVVFRYDDFQLINDSTNEKVVKLLNKYDIPVVLGVIPCNTDEDFVFDINNEFLTYIKNAEKKDLIEIALHGLNHRRMTPYGEMKGLSYEEQYRRIKKGKTLLETALSCKISTYIPPWNAHDENTIEALKQNDIYIVSSSVYDVYNDFIYYPLTTDTYTELNKIVEDKKLFGGILVVMIHPYDFKNPNSISKLEQMVCSLKKNKNISFYTFRGLNNLCLNVNSIQTDEQMHQNLLTKILKLKGVFISYKWIVLIRILDGLLYLIIFYFQYYIMQLLILKKHKHNLIQYTVLLAVGTVAFLSTWYYWLGPIKLLLLWLVVATIIPEIFQFFKIYKFRIHIYIERKD